MRAIYEAWAYLRWVTSYYAVVKASSLRAATWQL